MNFRCESPASSRTHRPTSNRGTVLMVALILSAAIGISLTSYLVLAEQTAKMSNRSFYINAAQDFCDLGVEQALWCMNNSNNWSGGDFTPVSGATSQYYATFPSATTYYNLSAGVKGQVKIWADVSNPNIPHIVVRSILTLNGGSTLSKEAEAYMKIASYFSSGMVGQTITFDGKVKADSWNSNPSGDGITSVPYSSSVANDQASVGAVSLTASALYDGNGRVAGSALVASDDSSGINLQPQGAVGNATFISSGQDGLQPGNVTYDFVADFPDVTAPATVNPLSSEGNITLPQTNAAGAIIDTPSADGKYYYSLSEIDLSSGQALTVNGNVVIVTSNTTGTTVSSTGNSGVYINSGGSLAIYTAGDVSLAGNGVLNGSNNSSYTYANRPINFAIYGTRSATTAATSGEQSIQIAGNGYLSGVVYAPNANVKVNGNADVLGAIVGNSVTMNGSANFHYDESLASVGNSGLWKIRKWRELVSASDQSPYTSDLNF